MLAFTHFFRSFLKVSIFLLFLIPGGIWFQTVGALTINDFPARELSTKGISKFPCAALLVLDDRSLLYRDWGHLFVLILQT